MKLVQTVLPRMHLITLAKIMTLHIEGRPEGTKNIRTTQSNKQQIARLKDHFNRNQIFSRSVGLRYHLMALDLDLDLGEAKRNIRRVKIQSRDLNIQI